VVVLRLVPGPFVALNLAAGLTPLRLRGMAIGTLIGGAPKALGWAALGLGATRLAVSPLVIAAVIVAGVALTVVWLRWRRPQATPAHAQPAARVAEPFPGAHSPPLAGRRESILDRWYRAAAGERGALEADGRRSGVRRNR
jgi:hypothetical protein